jgi:hypothetical protein
MKDSLKEFVEQNKPAFDAHQPPESSWKQIEMKLPPRRFHLWNSVILWRSVAILLMGVSAYLFMTKPVVKSSTGESVQLSGEFKDLEFYYSNQIVEKKELVSQIQSDTGFTEDEVTQNLKKLEAMYQVLKEEMEKRPSQDVKDALVLNLLVRIDLLNQQLNKLDKKNSKTEISNS